MIQYARIQRSPSFSEFDDSSSLSSSDSRLIKVIRVFGRLFARTFDYQYTVIKTRLKQQVYYKRDAKIDSMYFLKSTTWFGTHTANNRHHPHRSSTTHPSLRRLLRATRSRRRRRRRSNPHPNLSRS